MNETKEALQIWSALKPMITKTIDERTKSCVRSKKMVVVTAPNGSTIGVHEPFDTVTYNIPYSSAVSSAKVGDTVWVQWYYDNASTMIAISFGDGDVGFFPEMGSIIGNNLDNAVEPGLYKYESNYSNVPINAGGGLLVIEASWSLYQVAFCNSSPQAIHIWVRTKYYSSNTWGAWAQVGSQYGYPYKRGATLNTSATISTANQWVNTGLTVTLTANHIYAIGSSYSYGACLGIQLRVSSGTYTVYEHLNETGGTTATCMPVFFCQTPGTYNLWVKRGATGGANSYQVYDLGVVST